MNTLGEAVKVTIFGESHGPGVGCVLDGLPAGIDVDKEALARFMARRAGGQGRHTTTRSETDTVRFFSGLNPKGRTNGAPIALLIENSDTRSGDYEAMGKVPRPGHADLVAWRKWGDDWDRRGAGQFSGRLTAPLCAAGALCLQWLKSKGIDVFAHLLRVGDVEDDAFCARAHSKSAEEKLKAQMRALRHGVFPTVNEARGWLMERAIQQAASEGDSLGAVIEVCATGVPAGLGSPLFDGVENLLARALFAIPAVKGVEFGAGFEVARMRGSENNDPYILTQKDALTQEASELSLSVRPAKNDAGGILGGISTNAPILCRLAIKPTPSIAKRQRSVDLETGRAVELRVKGRHDPCVGPRAVPVAEAVFGLVLADLFALAAFPSTIESKDGDTSRS